MKKSKACERCGYQTHLVQVLVWRSRNNPKTGYRRKDGRSLSGPILASDRIIDVYIGLV